MDLEQEPFGSWPDHWNLPVGLRGARNLPVLYQLPCGYLPGLLGQRNSLKYCHEMFHGWCISPLRTSK